MVRKTIRLHALFSLFILAAAACGENNGRIKIGHGGGYLSAALYAAGGDFAADVQVFRSSSDIAYALLSGRLDAGFVEAEKLAAFAALDGFDGLTVVGKVTYPYGATLVLRKGLDLRLHDLGGITLAASAPCCFLVEEFGEDAERLDADISGLKYEYIPFDAMIPALEAGAVDAALIKGSYSVAALEKGHSILYQNWDMEPGDDCCPAIIDQAALVFLARRNKLNAVNPFAEALVSAQKLSPDRLRRAVADNTVIPYEILKGQPVPEFSRADDGLVKTFLEAAAHHDGGDHDE